MSETARLVTAEELEKYPEDDFRYELVEGRVIRMSPVGYTHGRVVMAFAFLLQQHVRAADLGVILTEVGFKLRSNPDTVRAPDLAYIRRERIPSIDPKGFWNGPPDLAVEVVSPEDTASEIRAKTEEYLARGVAVVVVIDPQDQTATVFSLTVPAVTRRGDEELDLNDVVPGFRCRVREIFE
jgi:Uma2 family endonuclease